MKRKIICQMAGTLPTIEKWFGERSSKLILEISDIIRPFMQEHLVHANYEMYFVTQYSDAGNATDLRVLSNLLPDCPTFYPQRESKYPYIEAGYLRDTSAPESLILKAKELMENDSRASYAQTTPITWPGEEPERVARQYVFERAGLRDKYRIRLFGGDAVELARELGQLTEETIGVGKWDTGLYHPYVLRQFTKTGNVYYEGMALTSLLPDMPTFYPVYSKPFRANRHGGFHDIRLPEELREKIAALDYSGVTIEPPRTRRKKSRVWSMGH